MSWEKREQTSQICTKPSTGMSQILDHTADTGSLPWRQRRAATTSETISLRLSFQQKSKTFQPSKKNQSADYQRGFQFQQDLRETGWSSSVELVPEGSKTFLLVAARQETEMITDAADACVQQEEARHLQQEGNAETHIQLAILVQQAK